MQKEDILRYLAANQEYYYNHFGIRFIGLFGSFARDEANNKSDIDILYRVEREKKFSLFSYLKVTKELEEYFHTKIDLVRDETIKPEIKNYMQKDLCYV